MCLNKIDKTRIRWENNDYSWNPKTAKIKMQQVRRDSQRTSRKYRSGKHPYFKRGKRKPWVEPHMS